MSQSYSSEPINFKNIITNRPSFEIFENIALLTTFYFDTSLDITNIYLEHNDIEINDDIIYKGMLVFLNTFSSEENEKKFQEYVIDFRNKKIDSEKKENTETILEIPDEVITNNKCSCKFCKIFNNAENILDNFKSKNNAELIILETLKSDSPKEYINTVYLNSDNYFLK